jgi:hypothetical protein
VPEIFSYAVGAVLSFTLLEAVLSLGFRRAMPQHHSRVLSLGTAFNVVSVVAGLGTGLLVAVLVAGWAAWGLAPFLAGTVYLVAESLESALAERILVRTGHSGASDVSG